MKKHTIATDSKTALVTGAAHGIGRCYAERLAAAGYRLILVDRDGGTLDTARQELAAAHGVTIDTLVMDKFGNIQQMNQACLKELNLNGDMIKGKSAFDVIDILVNKQNILPDLIRDLDSGKQQIDLPQNCVICNLQSNMIFMVQGTLIGTYKENRLNNVVFLFRNIESELTQEYILNMALSRTKIFPWFYDMKLDHMIIDSRWFSHLGIDEGNGTLSSECK